MANGNIITQNLNRNFQAAIKGLPIDQKDFYPDISSIRASAFAEGEKAAAKIIRANGNQSSYAGASISNTGYGMAKVASGGVVYTQPQFFSPIHTPINWQIPVKRKEQYTWARFYYENEPKVATAIEFYCFVPNTQIQTEYGTVKTIASIVPGEKIISGDGTIRKVVRKFQRAASEKIANIKVGGLTSTPIECTFGHEVLVKDKGYIQASTVKIGDFLGTPCPSAGKNTMSSGSAWLLGLYAAEGCPIPYDHESGRKPPVRDFKGVYLDINIEENWIAEKVKSIVESDFGECTITNRRLENNHVLRMSIYGKTIADFLCGFCPGMASTGTKRFSPIINSYDSNTIFEIVNGFFSGDGCFSVKMGFQGVGVCRTMMFQISHFLDILKIPHSLTSQHPQICKKGIKRQTIYNVRIPRSECEKFQNNTKVSDLWKSDIDLSSANNLQFFYENGYIWRKVKSIKILDYTGDVYDLEIEGEHSYTANKVAVHNSKFPINNFTNECSNRYVKHYFDGLAKNLHLLKWLRIMSHEVHLLGDCFPFLEVSCEKCGGSGVDRQGMVCEHENGSFKRLVVLNPECAEVYSDPISPESLIAFMPNDELRTLIMKRGPGYDRFSPDIIKMIMAGAPIPLDNRNVSHLKYCDNGYNKYGIGMLRRLFPILAYKTKLMTAQWIIAERLILPIKVAKVGSDERPASAGDLADINSKLAQVANDPNLTLVTHHAFELDWFGASFPQAVDTEILTRDGWKSCDQVNVDEIVAVCDLETKELRFEEIVAKHKYHFDGEMIRFASRYMDLVVTPDHQMVVMEQGKTRNEYSNPIKVRADEVKNNSKLITELIWNGKIPNALPIEGTPVSHLTLDEFLKFAGFYIAEGYIKTSKGSFDAISISQNEDSPSYQEMKFIVEKLANGKHMQFVFDKRTGKTNVQMYLHGRELAKYIAELFGCSARTKIIPRWILDLPTDKLNILMGSLMQGYGTKRISEYGSTRYKYSTASKLLAGQLQELLLKLGIMPNTKIELAKSEKHAPIHRIMWPLKKHEPVFSVRKSTVSKVPYSGGAWCVTTRTGTLVVRRNGRICVCGNSGKIMQLTNEFEIISQEILDGLGVNKVLLNGEGPTYSSAAIGVEVMIDKLDAWRSELSEWVEQKIYLPIAKMKGFIEKNEWGEYEYVYPKVKWDIMHLRDMQQMRTFILQLHEKGAISTQTMLKAFDIDYDQEVELLRYERAKGAQTGAGQQGDMGGGFGGIPDLGGMGAVAGGGGGDMGGLPEMGGGDMGGGLPGGDVGGGDMGGGMGASASNNVANITEFGGKVLKKKSREKISKYKDKLFRSKEKQNEASGYLRDDKGRIAFTGPERTLLKELASSVKRGEIRHNIQAQFPVKAGGEEYTIDFSMPDIKLGIEVDGALFHSTDEQIKSDKKRDSQLAQLGWTIIRFTDKEIENQVRKVIETIIKYQIQKENYIKNSMK